jgi:DNA-binding transcriptional LysR family regulator
MNLNHLRYFYFVAKEQGFTNASKALRIQQPAISRMVHQLEEDLGFKLFEKVGRNIRLTGKGVEVFEGAKRIFSEVEHLKLSVGKIKGECKGPLVIAAADVIASHFLPRVLRRYLLTHSRVYPNILSGPASTLISKIEKGDIELGLFFHVPELSDSLEVVRKSKVRFHLIVHRDKKKDKVVLSSFIGSRELDDTSNRRFPTLDRLKRDWPEARIAISSNNLSSHRRMVLEGMGVAVLPEFLIAGDIKEGRVVDLYPKEEMNFDLKIIKRRTAVLSKNAEEFLRVCV